MLQGVKETTAWNISGDMPSYAAGTIEGLSSCFNIASCQIISREVSNFTNHNTCPSCRPGKTWITIHTLYAVAVSVCRPLSLLHGIVVPWKTVAKDQLFGTYASPTQVYYHRLH